MADNNSSWYGGGNNYFSLGGGGNDYSSLDLPLSNWTNVNYSTLGLPTLPTSFEIPSAPVYDFSNYGSPVDSGSSAGDLTSYITDPSLWDQISGYVDKGVGVLGSVWDKLNVGSGSSGEGPSLLSQLGTLGLGGLSAYSNYDAYRTANELAKEKSDRDYALQQAQLGLSRDTNMLNQQTARVSAADNLSKTNALFDLIKQRQGVDLSGNMKSYTDQLSAQGWSPENGLAPVTSTLGQFGVTSRPEVPAPLSNTQLTEATIARDPTRAFASGGQAMSGSGQQPTGALGLLAGGSAGQDDKINARLSDGEYVVDADVVAALGDGNTLAGAKKLDQMRENIRQHKRSAPKGKIPPKARRVDAYLKGGK